MRFCIACFVAFMTLLPGIANAQTSIRFADAGAHGIELVPAGGAFEATVSIENVSSKPVRLIGLDLLRGTESLPVLPVGVTTRFVDGRSSRRLPPGGKKDVLVRWEPSPDANMREWYGHLVATTETDDIAVVGVRAEARESTLHRHVLSGLVLLPLLGALLLFVLGRARVAKPANLRRVALGVSGLQLGLGGWLYSNFNPAVSVLDGSGGFQFLERMSLLPGLGIELSLGVDGVSIVLVLLTAFLSFVAILLGARASSRQHVYWALLLAASSALATAFLAVDLALFTIAWAAAIGALASGVGIFGGAQRRRAVVKLASISALAIGSAAFVFWYLSGNAGETLLLDGSTAQRTFSVVELTRIDWLARGLTIGGVNAVAVMYSLVVLAAVCALPLAPVHTWLSDVLAEAPPGFAVLLAGGATHVGGYLLIRVGYAVLPAGTLWGAATVGALGLASIVWASLAALVENDLRRLVGQASVVQCGFVALSLSSSTGAGVQGAVAQMLSHGLVVAALVGALGFIHSRVETTRLDELGGLAKDMPRLAVLFGVVVLASVGLPGSSGFVGQWMSVASAMPMNPGLAIGAAASLVLLGAFHWRAFSRLFLGNIPETWTQSRHLEPHGGRFPELRDSELSALIPLVVAIILVGLHPFAVLRLVASSALDHAERVHPPSPTQLVKTHPMLKAPATQPFIPVDEVREAVCRERRRARHPGLG